ncbi:MAG: hypothetical protein ACTS8R_03320 [Arsenophonus sp. NC-QC1-MAG3]
MTTLSLAQEAVESYPLYNPSFFFFFNDLVSSCMRIPDTRLYLDALNRYLLSHEEENLREIKQEVKASPEAEA